LVAGMGGGIRIESNLGSGSVVITQFKAEGYKNKINTIKAESPDGMTDGLEGNVRIIIFIRNTLQVLKAGFLNWHLEQAASLFTLLSNST